MKNLKTNLGFKVLYDQFIAWWVRILQLSSCEQIRNNILNRMKITESIQNLAT